MLTPTAPAAAPRLGESLSDPLRMYLSDIDTVPVNLAGLPGSVITRARQLLQELEAGAAQAQPVEKPEADQVSMLDMSGQAVCRELQKVAVETLTPIEAMNLLFRLKQML